MGKKKKATKLTVNALPPAYAKWLDQRTKENRPWGFSKASIQQQDEDVKHCRLSMIFYSWMHDLYKLPTLPENKDAQQALFFQITYVLNTLKDAPLVSQSKNLEPKAVYSERLFNLALQTIALKMLNPLCFELMGDEALRQHKQADLFLAAVNYQLIQASPQCTKKFSDLHELAKLAQHGYLQQENLENYVQSVLVEFKSHVMSQTLPYHPKPHFSYWQDLLDRLMDALALLPPISDDESFQSYNYYQISVCDELIKYISGLPSSNELSQAYVDLLKHSQEDSKLSDVHDLILANFEHLFLVSLRIKQEDVDDLSNVSTEINKAIEVLPDSLTGEKTPYDSLLKALKNEWSYLLTQLQEKQKTEPTLERLTLQALIIKHQLQTKQNDYLCRQDPQEQTRIYPMERPQSVEFALFNMLMNISGYYTLFPTPIVFSAEDKTPDLDEIIKKIGRLSATQALDLLKKLKESAALKYDPKTVFNDLIAPMEQAKSTFEHLNDESLLSLLNYYSLEFDAPELFISEDEQLLTSIETKLYPILNPADEDGFKIEQFHISIQQLNGLLHDLQNVLHITGKSNSIYYDMRKSEELLLLTWVSHLLQIQQFENNRSTSLSNNHEFRFLTWIELHNLLDDILVAQIFQYEYYFQAQHPSLIKSLERLIDICMLQMHILKIIIDNEDEKNLLIFLKTIGPLLKKLAMINKRIPSLLAGSSRILNIGYFLDIMLAVLKLIDTHHPHIVLMLVEFASIKLHEIRSHELINNDQTLPFKKQVQNQFAALPKLPESITSLGDDSTTMAIILNTIHRLAHACKNPSDILLESAFKDLQPLPKQIQQRVLGHPPETWQTQHYKDLTDFFVKPPQEKTTNDSPSKNRIAMQPFDLRDFQLKISPAHGQKDEETVIDDLKIINDPKLQSVLKNFDSPNIKGLSTVIRLLKIQDIAKALQTQQFEATPRALSAVWTELSKRLICKMNEVATDPEKIHRLKNAACETMAIAARLSLQALETECLNPLAHSHKTPEEKKKWLNQQRQMALFKEAAYILIRLYKLYDSLQQEEPINIFDLGAQAMDITDVQKTWWTQIWNFLLDKKNSDTNKITLKEAVSRLYQLLFEDTRVTQQPTQQAIDAHQQKIAQAQAARLEQEKQWRAEFQKKERQNSNPKKDNTTPSDDTSSLQSSPVKTPHQSKGALLVTHTQTPSSGKKHSKERKKEGQFISNFVNKPKRPKRPKKATQASDSIVEKPHTPTQTASLDSAPAAKEATSTHTDAPKHPSKVKATHPFFATPPSSHRFFQPQPSEASLASSAISPALLHPITQRFCEFGYFIFQNSDLRNFQMVHLDIQSIFAQILTSWMNCALGQENTLTIPQELTPIYHHHYTLFLKNLKAMKNNIILRILAVYTHFEQLCAHANLPIPVSAQSIEEFLDKYKKYPLYDREEFLEAIDRCREQIINLYMKELLNPDEVRQVYFYLYHLHYLKISAHLCLLSKKSANRDEILETMLETLIDQFKIRITKLKEAVFITCTDISQYRDILKQYALNLRQLLDINITFESADAQFNTEEAMMRQYPDENVTKQCLLNLDALLKDEILIHHSIHTQLLSFLAGNKTLSPTKIMKLTQFFNRLSVLLEQAKYIELCLGVTLKQMPQQEPESAYSPHFSV